MKVLGYNFSQKFDVLYQEVSEIVGCPIEFMEIKKEDSRTDYGYTNTCPTKGTYKIHLATFKLSRIEAEIIAAHELLHLKSDPLGKLAGVGVAMGKMNPNYEKLRKIGVFLRSVLNHIIIIPEMHRRGFDQNVIGKKNFDILKNSLENLRSEPRVGTKGFIDLTLQCLEMKTCYPKYWFEIEPLVRNKMPKIDKVVEEAIEIIKRFGYDTPKKYLNCIVEIRNLLGLQGQVLIRNQETGMII